jgi:hypothetical protein
MTTISKDEIELQFRGALKKLKCISCGEQITDAAIDWGFAQPSEYERDGPFPVKCELCETILDYNYFDETLSLAAGKANSTR